jgi:hypothetical protein
MTVKDSTTLLRDIAGDAATNAAAKVKPSEEALAQIDRPAEDNTWHDPPDLSKGNVKAQLQSAYKGSPAGDAKNAAASGADAAHQPDGTVDAQAGARVITDEAKSKVDPETRESVKETAENYRARTRQYLARKVPQERREQTIWRLKV